MNKRASVTGVIVCILLFVGLSLHGATRTALTYDEPSHLASGYSWLARGSDGLWTIPQRGHPLLIDAFNALPLYIGNPDVPVEALPGWQIDRRTFAEAFIADVASLPSVEVAARVPMTLLTVLLVAVVYRWTADLTTPLGGLVAAALLAFDPNVLAHGRLATNDVGVTALGTFALFLAWRWLRHRTWRLGLASGALLGMTMLAKASGLLWTAAVMTVGGFGAVFTSGDPFRRRRWAVLQPLGMGFVALIVVWAAYGFSVGPIEELGSIPLPAPLHWRSLLFQTSSAEQRLAFALGRLKMGGWWWYFPVAYLLKTPLPVLLAVPIGVFVAGRMLKQRRAGARSWAFAVATFSALYLGVAITRGPNIGYRHLLPVVPYLHQLAALSITALWRRRQLAIRVGLVILGLCYAASTWTVHPYEITFFNILAGGPGQGYRYLVSSNVEWGQSAKALHAFLAAHRDETTYLAYAHPAPYDLPADHALTPAPGGVAMASPFHPSPGLYLIGATSLQIPSSCCEVGLLSYGWFRHREPSLSIGNAVLGYEIPSQSQPKWVVQCANPTPPLSSETLRQGLDGSAALRTLAIDCTRAWLYPDAGRTPGIVALPETVFTQSVPWFHCNPRLLPCPNRAADPFVDARLTPLRLSYRQPEGFIPPPFRLYEPVSSPDVPDRQRGYPAPAGAQPAALNDAQPLPIAFEGPLTLLGVDVLLEDPETLEVATWWQVTGVPPSAPISLMAHLIEGEAVTVGDALDLPVLLWRPGDIFVQRHTFARSSSDDIAGSAWLRLGAYDVGSGRRWPLRDWADRDAVFVATGAMAARSR